MLPTLIFATNNINKVKEIRVVLNGRFDVISLREAGIDIDIPEPHATLEANASEKSYVIHRLTDKNCFSEDTGLEVAALGGAPGVRSARFAGEACDTQANIAKLLAQLGDAADRSARFRTVISLILDGEEYQFEGLCKGTITIIQTGDAGFGYDPIFIPDGSSKTFAEMGIDEKNIFSHRKKATEKFTAFLNEHYGKD